MVEDRKGLSSKGIQSWIKDTFANEVISLVFNKTLKNLVAKNGVNQHKGHYVMTKKQKENPKTKAKEKREKERERVKVKKDKQKEKKKEKAQKNKDKATQ